MTYGSLLFISHCCSCIFCIPALFSCNHHDPLPFLYHHLWGIDWCSGNVYGDLEGDPAQVQNMECPLQVVNWTFQQTFVNHPNLPGWRPRLPRCIRLLSNDCFKLWIYILIAIPGNIIFNFVILYFKLITFRPASIYEVTHNFCT